MFKHLLVPVDSSDLSSRAMDASIELATKLGARITGFVAEPDVTLALASANPSTFVEQVKQHEAEAVSHAQALLAQFKARADAAGIAFSGDFQSAPQIDQAIVEAAERAGADLILMVTHGRGVFGELVFGSHTKNVMSRTKLPLLVLH